MVGYLCRCERCVVEIVLLKGTRFATDYIGLNSFLKKKVNLKKKSISNEWTLHKLSHITIGQEVKKLMFNHPY